MSRRLIAPRIALAFLLLPCASAASGFSFDDCILSGLKGVASDAAARLVQRACESKRLEHQKARDIELGIEYGRELKHAELQMFEVDGWAPYSRKSFEARLINKASNSDLTLTYVRLNVSSIHDGFCRNSRSFAYSVRLPPGEVTILQFPAVDGSSDQRLCIDVAYGRGRPANWRDKATALLPSRREPLPSDIFAGRDDAEPPAPAPAPAPAAAPEKSGILTFTLTPAELKELDELVKKKR